MFFYHWKLLLIFLILNIINFVALYNKKKHKKLSLITNTLCLTFSIVMIITMNKEYISFLYKDNPVNIFYYLNLVKKLNTFFFITSLISTIILLTISLLKIKYRVLYAITVVLLIILYIVLFFLDVSKTINIKYILDFGMLAECLKHYYLSIITIPLLLKNQK